MRPNRGYMICKSGHPRAMSEPPAAPFNFSQGDVSEPPGRQGRCANFPGRISALFLRDPADRPWSRRLFTAIVGAPRLVRSSVNRNVRSTRQKLVSRSPNRGADREIFGHWSSLLPSKRRPFGGQRFRPDSRGSYFSLFRRVACVSFLNAYPRPGLPRARLFLRTGACSCYEARDIRRAVLRLATNASVIGRRLMPA